jgi:hypothetical protein
MASDDSFSSAWPGAWKPDELPVSSMNHPSAFDTFAIIAGLPDGS